MLRLRVYSKGKLHPEPLCAMSTVTQFTLKANNNNVLFIFYSTVQESCNGYTVTIWLTTDNSAVYDA